MSTTKNNNLPSSYVLRHEGAYGFLIALFAGLYPLLSHFKAKLEDD